MAKNSQNAEQRAVSGEVIDPQPDGPGTDVATRDETETALAPYARTISTDALDIVRENMGGRPMFDMLQLPRVRIPTGGNTVWKMSTVDGTRNVEQIDGVIAHMTPVKGYWATSFEREPNQPPSCSSRDGVTGFGYRGAIDDAVVAEAGGEVPDDARYDLNGNLMTEHECEGCPLNAFGTKLQDDGTKGRGKACKDMRALFVVQEGNIIPNVVMLSPMSIKPQGDYFMALSGVSRRFWQVETGITLTEERNSRGVAYARAEFKRVRNLEQSEIDQMVEYRRLLLPSIEAAFVPLTAEDADTAQTD